MDTTQRTSQHVARNQPDRFLFFALDANAQSARAATLSIFLLHRVECCSDSEHRSSSTIWLLLPFSQLDVSESGETSGKKSQKMGVFHLSFPLTPFLFSSLSLSLPLILFEELRGSSSFEKIEVLNIFFPLQRAAFSFELVFMNILPEVNLPLLCSPG